MVNCQNKARTTTQFFSGTLNVRGLTSKTKRECLDELFADHNLDVLCLQETKTKNEETIQQKNSTLHLLFSSTHHYGLGFAVSKKWTKLTTHKISDRVAILEGNLKGAHFKIVNCYGPTQILSNKKQEIYEEFLEVLQANIKTKSNQILILQEDFNAKIGRNSIKSTHKGHFSRGCENKNGSLLNEFLAIKNFTATNTLFKHPARHLTTWQEKLNNKMVFNTIDYIITQQKIISYIKNSRSYSGIKLSTDHRLVKVILQIPEPHQLWKKPKQQNTKLTYQQTNIKNFSNLISTNFTNIEGFQKIIYKSALKCFKKQSNQQTKIKDPEINKLKNKINKIRNILKNCKINQTTKISLNKEKHHTKTN